MDRTDSFGYWLRRRRKALDLTQAELAERASCSINLIQKIETDARRPSRQVAAKLADVLGLDGVERQAFIQAARAERAVDQLALPDQPVAPPVAALPQGTVTFLFTDIAGSTRLWERYPQAMPAALARHDALLQSVVAAHGGVVFKTVGDSLLAAFARAPDALAAALAALRAVGVEPWELPEPIQVRLALHTGHAEPRGGDYFGPTLNRAARLLAAGHGGQLLLSLAAVQLLRDHLPAEMRLRDLGTHQLKDLSLPEQIFQLEAVGLLASFPPLNTLSTRRTNLPTQPTELLGRELVIADVAALLRRPATRLVTLVGPGGAGKTRLSLAIAAELLDDFADGAYFVDLAPIRDPSLVPSALAQALGLREGGGQPLASLVKDYLRERQMLLLLDNFEQVLDAAPLVAELLAAAPRLKLLCTSREALRLRGEKVVPVQPLALPERGQLPPLEQLSQYSAVALFIERAVDVQASFAVTNANAPAVAEICARLEGLPLAIELAAAGVTLFSPDALLARLSRRLPLPALGPRDLPARQQTMRSTIAWSYDLLGEGERALFRRLGVFAGGWTLAAAEGVAADQTLDGEGAQPASAAAGSGVVVDLLARLVNKSLVLVVVGLGSEPRYRMLEPIREYALEQLTVAGEEAAVRSRHLDYYLNLATSTQPMSQKRLDPRMSVLAAELDNVRAALDWAQEHAVIRGLRLASALWRFCLRYGHGGEFIGRLKQLLARPEAAEATVERARSLQAAAELEAWDSFAESRTLAEESLAIHRALGDRRGEASNLLLMGNLAIWQGDARVGRAVIQQSVDLFRAVGDHLGLASALLQVAAYTPWDEYRRARATFEEALGIYREQGDTVGLLDGLEQLDIYEIHCGHLTQARAALEESLELQRDQPDGTPAGTLHDLGALNLHEGKYTEAREYLEACLHKCKAAGNPMLGHWVIGTLGYVALREGDLVRARTTFREALRRFTDAGVTGGVIYMLEGMASLLTQTGSPERATQLFAWADTARTAIGNRRPPIEQAMVDRDLAVLRAQLVEPRFASAWAAGGALSTEQAIALA